MYAKNIRLSAKRDNQIAHTRRAQICERRVSFGFVTFPKFSKRCFVNLKNLSYINELIYNLVTWSD